jgi:hypothetical protein
MDTNKINESSEICQKEFCKMEIESIDPKPKMFYLSLKPIGLTRLNILVMFQV